MSLRSRLTLRIRRQDSFAGLKFRQTEGHLRRKISDRNPSGVHVADTLGYEAKVLLLDGKIFTVGPVFQHTVQSGEHHA